MITLEVRGLGISRHFSGEPSETIGCDFKPDRQTFYIETSSECGCREMTFFEIMLRC
jgi:hypothetical protein